MMTSQVIRALEVRRILKRTVSARDARARVVSVTEAGRMLLAEALPAVETADKAFFGVLGKDVKALNSLLVRLANAEGR
jgi:DNA-binding MarR family transcriptional regulator